MARSTASSSIKQQFLRYDVFLNHRGPDTKKSFVIPLEQKLREQGIQPFLDRHDIHHGENVFKTIEEAIRSAHMHIAIFSKNYAQSTYCLNELYQMSLTGKPIVTVFYDVEPEHVRRPRKPDGPYKEAFKKHEEREKSEDVQRWVNALEDAAGIRGFVRADSSNDDELEEKIVLEVIRIRNRSPQRVLVPPQAGYYDWKSHYYKFPTEGQGIISFTAESIGDYVLVAITLEPQVTYPMYEVVIRAGDNSKSAIRRNVIGDMWKDVCLVTGVLIDSNFGNLNQYWVSIDVETQLIQVGRGKLPDLASVFCVYKDINFLGNAQYVAFSSWDKSVTYTDISIASISSSTSSDVIKNSTEQLWNMSKVGILPDSSGLPMIIQPVNGHFDWSRHYKLSSEGRGFVLFSAETSNDVHVAISSRPETVDALYHIVIGGFANSTSVIRRRWDGENLCLVPTGLINPRIGDLNHFWVSINAETQLIQVGRGKQPDLGSVFCIYKDIDFIRQARYVSFSSWDRRVIYSDISVASPPTSQDSTEQLLKYMNDQVGIMREPSDLISFVAPPMHGVYSWVRHYQLPTQGEGLVSFAADCPNDVHVAISPEPHSMLPMYEIVIGGWNNTRSVIRRRSQGPILCDVAVGLIKPQPDAVNYLWVSIDKTTQLIQVGRGKQPSQESLLCIYKDVDFICTAQCVSFSSWDRRVTYSDISVATLVPSSQDFTEQLLNMTEVGIVQEPSDLRIVVPPMYGVYNWVQYYQLPKQGRGFLSFAAECSNDVHVAISSEPQSMDPMYEIVIGGWKNTSSVIRRRSQGSNLCTVAVGLIKPQSDAVNYLWVSIDKKTQLIQVGHGKQPDLPSVFCIYKDVDFLRKAQYVSFSSWDARVTYSVISVAFLKSPTSGSTALSAASVQGPGFSEHVPKRSCQVM